MKIFLVISSLSSGGAERVMSNMANYWASNGLSVSLVTLNSWIEDFYVLNEKVNRISFNDSIPRGGLINKIFFNFNRIYYLRGLFKQHKPDVIISFLDVTNVTTILAANGLRSKVIVSERIDPGSNPLLNNFWFYLRKFVYKKSNIVVAQTKSAAAWLDENCGVSSYVIPNPVRNLNRRIIKREKRIISVGRLDKQKGHDILIRASAKVFIDSPDWSLEIYGTGPEEENLLNLITELGLDSKINLKGVTHDVDKIFSEAGIFVLASRYEGFPNVLLEAMSLGCPVISTNCRSGPSDLINDGINGFLVNVDDEEELAKKILFLIKNPQKRFQIGSEAEKVKHLFSESHIMAKWNKLINLKVL